MPFCLRCTKETSGQRCACCPQTYYCSKECQEDDWHTAHKHEQHFYKLAAAGDGASGDTISSEQQQQQKVETTEFKEINADRLEFERLVSLQRQYMANRVPSADEARMTQQQRQELEMRMRQMIVDPMALRRARHQKTTQLVSDMIAQFGPVPSSVEGAAPRQPALDEATQARLASLLRKHDLLHLRQVYALSTRRAEDQAELMRYRVYVDDQERRFVHALLFADDPNVTYEATLRHRRAEERDALADECARYLLGQSVEQTAALCVRYLQAMERRERREQQQRQFGAPPKTKAKRTPKKGEKDEEDEEKTDGQLVGMFEAKRRDTANGYTPEATSNVARTVLGSKRAEWDQAYKDGVMDEETRQGSYEYAKRLWDNMNRSMSLKRTEANNVWEATAGYMKEIWDKIKADNRLDNTWLLRMRTLLSWDAVAGLFATVVLFQYVVVVLGYAFFKDPLSPEIRAKQAALLEQRSLIDQQRADLMTTKEIVDGTKDAIRVHKALIDGEPRADPAFMQLNLGDPRLDALANRVMVNSTMTGLLGKVDDLLRDEQFYIEEMRAATAEAARASGVALLGDGDEYPETNLVIWKEVRKLIEKIQQSKTLFGCRNAIDALRRYIEGSEKLTNYMGETTTLAQVRKILDEFEKFATTTDQNIDNITRALKAQEGHMGLVRDVVVKQHTEMMEAAMKAPTMGSLLNLVGAASGVTGYLLYPLAQMGATYAVYQFASDVRPAGAFHYLQSTEALFHNLSETAGLRSTASWGEWAHSVSYMALMPSLAKTEMMFYAMCACSLLFHYVPSAGLAARAATRGTYKAFRWLAQQLTLQYCCADSELAADDEDYVKAKEILDEIKTIHDEKEYGEKALEARVNGVLTPRQYAIAVSLIMNKNTEERPTHDDVFLNRIGASMNSVGALLHLVGVACRLALYINYYKKLRDIFYAMVTILTTVMVSHEGMVAMVVVGLVALYAHVVGRSMAEARERDGEATQHPLWHFLAPLDALFRYIVYPDATKLIAVNLIHQTLCVWPLIGTDLVFQSFVETVNPEAGAERLALANTADLLSGKTLVGAANDAVALTNVTSPTGGLIDRSLRLFDQASWQINQYALVSHGTIEQVNEAQKALEKYNELAKALAVVPQTTG